MQHLDNIVVFVKVAEFESISKAARSLDMPVSTVSRKLSVLESALGVSLVRRPTTNPHPARPRLLQPMHRAAVEASRSRTGPHSNSKEAGRNPGDLRPDDAQSGSIYGFLSDSPKSTPGIRIDLYITNAFLNLVAENIDVAVRFGHLQDSSVVAANRQERSLRGRRGGLPQGAKFPTEPEDLRAYDCVMFNAKNYETDWDLLSGRRKVRVRVTGSVSSRDCQSAAAFVLRGHGVGLLETAYCDQALARGDLVRLLPRWTSADIPVFAVYPTRKFLPPRVTAFLKALTAWKNSLWIRG